MGSDWAKWIQVQVDTDGTDTTLPPDPDQRQLRGPGDDYIPADAALETTEIAVSHDKRGGAEGVYAGRRWRGVDGRTYSDVWPEAELAAVFDARGRLVRIDVHYPGDGEG